MMQKKNTKEKKFIFTTKIVEEITKKINDGYILKRYENPWLKNEVGTKRSGITFKASEEEINEWIKCSLDIQYFAEKYCKIKREDGSIGSVKLRDYQKNILDLFEGRYSILMASRQVGKCSSFNTLIELENGEKERLGVLYYSMTSMYRKLTFLEKLKMFFYNIVFLIEGSNKN